MHSKYKDNTDKMYLYTKDLSEFLTEKHENDEVKHLSDPKVFIECSDTMDYVHENISDYNSTRKKFLIVFDDTITDIMSNKKFHVIVKDLFINCKKLHILLAFISQSYFSVPKDARSSTTHLFIMNINNKRKLQNIAINNSAD